MKNIDKLNNSFFSLITLICLLFSLNTQANTQAKKERVRMKMYYFKQADGDRMISIALTAGSGKKMHGVINSEVVLTSVLNDSTITLATIETDTLGEVQLYLASDYILPMDEDGKSIVEASYDGNETYRAASSDIEVMDVDIDFEYKIEDSVKYLSVVASSINGAGEKIPVEELSINIGVQRLHSVLTLDEIETDEEGIGELEISNDIPGDAEGKLIFVAYIDDHDEFGTVTKTSENSWGVPVDYELSSKSRQLFTDEAPIWMIAAVFIILLGAWYHFFLSISKLVKLKKEGDVS